MPLDYRVDITAGRDFGSRLAGLGTLIGQGREKKRLEKEKADADLLLKEARKKAQAAIANKDPKAMADILSEFPQLADAIEASMNIGGEMQKQQRTELRRTYEQILADPLRAPRILNERIVMLEKAGRDPSQSIELFDEFMGDDPEGALKTVEVLYAGAIGPEEFKKYQDARAEAPDEDTTATQTLKARALGAGLTEGTPEYQAFMLHGGAPPTDALGSQKNQEIDALTKMYGPAVENPRELATKVVYGIVDVEFLEDGTVMLTDKSLLTTDPENAVKYIPVGNLNTETPRAVPHQGQTLYELASTVGGIEGSVKQLLSNVAGQFGFEAFPEEMEAYQTLNTAMGDMTRSLMVGDRWTVGQANMLREELNIKASIGSPGPQTNMRMRSIDQSLKFRLQQFERDSKDTTLDRQTRSMQRSNAATIRNFVDLLGAPEKIDAADVTMDTVEGMDINSINEFINNATREELNSLPDQVVDMLEQRRNSGR